MRKMQPKELFQCLILCSRYFVVALKTKPALKINDAREALSSACGEVRGDVLVQCNYVTLAHIVGELQQGGGRKFLGGNRADRGDLAAFGKRVLGGGGGGGGVVRRGLGVFVFFMEGNVKNN